MNECYYRYFQACQQVKDVRAMFAPEDAEFVFKQDGVRLKAVDKVSCVDVIGSNILSNCGYGRVRIDMGLVITSQGNVPNLNASCS